MQESIHEGAEIPELTQFLRLVHNTATGNQKNSFLTKTILFKFYQHTASQLVRGAEFSKTGTNNHHGQYRAIEKAVARE